QSGLIRPYRSADPSIQRMFMDMDPNEPIFVDQVINGWQVIYMRAHDMDGAPGVANWYAECTEETTLEAKGFFATVDGDDWTPTHGDHEEEPEVAQMAVVLDEISPTLRNIKELRVAIAKAELELAQAG